MLVTYAIHITAGGLGLLSGFIALYASKGGGQPGLRRAAGYMCDRGSRLMANGQSVDRFPLPRSGMVRMYFVTATGVRMTEASVRILESEFPNEQAAELSGLFGNALSLVAALREARNR